MKIFELYTDGSHIKNPKVPGIGRLGIGAVLVGEGGIIVDSLSLKVDRSTIAELYKTGDVSNPTMEMYAVLVSLKEFSRHFSFGDTINITADYEGVKHWMYHKWKINKPYIYMIREDIFNEVKNQKISVSYHWVKSHNGNIYNEMADKLAKGELKKV